MTVISGLVCCVYCHMAVSCCGSIGLQPTMASKFFPTLALCHLLVRTKDVLAVPPQISITSTSWLSS